MFGLVIALVIGLLVLRHRGRLGPFTWVGAPPVRPALAPASDAPERVLAGRLADGQISSDEYLERLSLLQSR